jgi:hypothetical protein
LNYAQNWADLFNGNPPVANEIALEVKNYAFPNYSTLQTQFSAIEINLLAGLTGWAVVSTEQSTKTFSGLFTPQGSAVGGAK